MANGIDEISMKLGALAEGQDSLHRELATLRIEFQEHNKHNRLQIENLLEFKNKGMGLLLGVSLVAGSVGSWLHSIWETFKGQGIH